MNIEGLRDRESLRILRDIPGVRAVRGATADQGADVVIRAGHVHHTVEVKTRREANAVTARQLVDSARRLPKGTYLLLVARKTTVEARRILEEAGIGVIDSLGNIRVDFPGMYLWTEGGPSVPSRDPGVDGSTRLTGKAGVVAQALLRSPERQWKVRDLADEAMVSVGLAHRVLARLEREQVVESDGAGPKRTRRVTNPTALLDLWAEEIHDRGVKLARAFRLARDPRAGAAVLSRALDKAAIDHAVTGAAAATLLAPFITAIPVTDIWVAETVTIDEATAAARADKVDEGHNVVLRQAVGDTPLAFRQRVDDVWIANPFRLFYDLRQDPRRGREQADRLREEVIGF